MPGRSSLRRPSRRAGHAFGACDLGNMWPNPTRKQQPPSLSFQAQSVGAVQPRIFLFRLRMAQGTSLPRRQTPCRLQGRSKDVHFEGVAESLPGDQGRQLAENKTATQSRPTRFHGPPTSPPLVVHLPTQRLQSSVVLQSVVRLAHWFTGSLVHWFTGSLVVASSVVRPTD